MDQLVEASDKAVVDSCDYTSPTIVLIIGESYNKHHAQLYGYYMPTTPRQLARERTGQLVKFTDVVTSWNLTSFVFKHMLSLYVVGDEGSWSDYPLFPKVFKQAGYDVTFLTNQFLTKAKEAVFDFSGGFFLNHPQLSDAMFSYRNTTIHPWDDGLLKDWDEKVSSSSSREVGGGSLVIFHLLGQHMNYYSRYPKKQTHFTAADYEEHRPKMLPHHKKQLVWYDNATLYNDSIVDQIIRRFEKQAPLSSMCLTTARRFTSPAALSSVATIATISTIHWPIMSMRCLSGCGVRRNTSPPGQSCSVRFVQPETAR